MILRRLFSLSCLLITGLGPAKAQSWTELGTGAGALNANDYIRSIALDTAGKVYAGGDFTNNAGNQYVAQWNGTAWSELGTNTNALNANDYIYSVFADAAVKVYAAGAFTNSGDDQYVAKWDGTAWSELGTGANALNANDYIRSIAADTAGMVYAAGDFTNSSGNQYVARWNGTAWSELGTGANALNANDYIRSIALDTAGMVYAAGDFTNSASNQYVAQWNGTAWSELGTGTNALNANDYIYSIIADAAGNVYAAGAFTNSNGDRYVAQWNGTAWSELGAGVNALNANDDILSVTVDAIGNVYAAGIFTNSGGDYYVAKWNGTTWSELGVGTNALNADDYIRSIAVDAVNNVYAAGDFLNSSSNQYVAIYNSNCSGTPVAGTVTTAQSSVDCNTTALLTLNGNTASQGISYQWQYNVNGAWNNFGTGADTVTTPPIIQSTKFRCYLVCNNPGGGSDTAAAIIISPLPLPVNLGSDINRCLDEGDTIMLDAGPFPGTATYTWNDGSIGRTKTVDQSGTFSVKVTDQNTCTGYDTIKVTLRDNPVVNLGNDTTVCNGGSLTLDAGSDGIAYYWNTTDTTQMITVNAAGSYIAFVTNTIGCMKSDTIIVTTHGEMPSAQGIIVSNNGAYTFQFTAISPLNVVTYEWDFGDGSPHSDLASPIHTYASGGNYIVVLKLSNTCGSIIDSSSAHIVGVNQIVADNNELTIYPNPSGGSTTLISKNLSMENVSVYNGLGQLVKMIKPDSDHKHLLQLTSLQSGIYIIHILTDKGVVVRKLELIK